MRCNATCVEVTGGGQVEFWSKYYAKYMDGGMALMFAQKASQKYLVAQSAYFELSFFPK